MAHLKDHNALTSRKNKLLLIINEYKYLEKKKVLRLRLKKPSLLTVFIFSGREFQHVGAA